MSDADSIPDGTEIVDDETVTVEHDSEFIAVQLVAMRNNGSREVIKGTNVPGTYGLAAFPSVFTPRQDGGRDD